MKAACERRVRLRAWVVAPEIPSPSRRWSPKPDQPVAILHVLTDRGGEWTFACLRELIGDVVVGEYLAARTRQGMEVARRYATFHRAATGPGLVP